MKYLLVLSFLLSASAFANNQQLSCKSADGTIEFTQDEFVIKITHPKELYVSLEAFHALNGTNYFPSVGTTLEFKSPYETQANLKLVIQKLGKVTRVAGEENYCGVGFQTDKATVQAEMEKDTMRTAVKFTCYSYLGFHGHDCR